MKNIGSTIAFLLLLVSNQLQAQSYNLLWDKTYGGNSRDWNCMVTFDSDGNLFLTGDSQTNVDGDKTLPVCQGTTNADIWMVKLDTAGMILWQRDIGGEGDERSPSLIHLNNAAKEMLLISFSSSDSACDKTEPNRDTVPLLSADYWICKLDSNGAVLWDKTLGGDNYDDNVVAAVLPNGEILLCGESNSPVGYDKSVANYSISNDFWALKLDANGNKIWDNVFGGLGTETVAGILADPDGSFLIAGSTNSDVSGDVSEPSQGLQDFWMIKVDASGTKVWDKRYGGTGPDICNYVSRTPDNGYILCGYTVSPQGGDVSEPPKGSQDYWVVKVDSVGNKLWDKRYGGTNGSFGTWVSTAQGGGYWIGGYSDSFDVLDVSEAPFGKFDYWFLKIDDSGNKLFDKRLGGTGDDFFGGIGFTSDSSMFAFGYSDTGNSTVKTAPVKGWLDYWLVKFTYTDTLTSLPAPDDAHIALNLMPNPAKEACFVTFKATRSEQVQISVYDLAGRMVYATREFANFGMNSFQLDLTNLQAGSYLIRLETASGNKASSRLVTY